MCSVLCTASVKIQSIFSRRFHQPIATKYAYLNNFNEKEKKVKTDCQYFNSTLLDSNYQKYILRNFEIEDKFSEKPRGYS